MFQAMPARKRLLFATLLLGVTASCASVSFERETLTSGTFESTGVAFTILSIDLPKSAIDIARENASDARQPNTQITDAKVIPYLGWFDWLLDIVGVRYAKVEGTWGFAPGQ